MSDCTPVFPVRYEEEEITNERVSEYKHTTFTQQCQDGPSEQQTLERYPELTNKSSDLIEALLSDFEQAQAKYEGDDSRGADWWRTECLRLESELKALMDTIYRMRGLHVVTKIVDEDKINDASGVFVFTGTFVCNLFLLISHWEHRCAFSWVSSPSHGGQM